ncbi:hypothetical protein F5887DRAFT_1088620 [Amanita rubescens]|nr:hypothetical protein F5887DRAFT_1088620 [Amanita rubescens]
MSFSSIFHVNGEVVSARVDLQHPITTISNDFLQRGELTEGHFILISVPVGEAIFSAGVVVHAEDQYEDLVLGVDWLHQYRSYASTSPMISSYPVFADACVRVQHSMGNPIPVIVAAGSSALPAIIDSSVPLSPPHSCCDQTVTEMGNVPSDAGLSMNPHGKVRSFNSEYLHLELSHYFGPSVQNIIRCSYPDLVKSLTEHGMVIGSWTVAEARSMLTYHVVSGMCTGQTGVHCKFLACGGVLQAEFLASVLENITDLCRQSLISLADLRFICFSLGINLNRLNSVDEILHAMHSATCFAPGPRFFELVQFYESLEKASKHELLAWCAGHGIFPGSSTSLIKEQLLKHVVLGHCVSSDSSICFPDCVDVRVQQTQSFTDTDPSAFALSLLCQLPNVHRLTLLHTVEIVTGVSQRSIQYSLSSLRHKLCGHIFNLRRGKSVYLSVLDGVRNPKIYTQKIKSLFEQQIVDSCMNRGICAACSIRYASDEYTTVDMTEVDLNPLFNPDRDDQSTSDDPLSPYLLDECGIINASGTQETLPQLLLCHDCYRELSRSRLPKFTLANFLNVGDVPDML